MPELPNLEVIATSLTLEEPEKEPLLVTTDRLELSAAAHGLTLPSGFVEAAEIVGDTLPISLLEHERCLPLGIADGVLTLAVAEPFHAATLARLSMLAPENTRFVGAPAEEIDALFARWRAEAAPEPTAEERIEARIEELSAQLEASDASRTHLESAMQGLASAVGQLVDTVQTSLNRPPEPEPEPAADLPEPLPQVDIEALVGLIEARLPAMVVAALPAPAPPDTSHTERFDALSQEMAEMRAAQEQWQRNFAAETQDRLVNLMERMNDALAAVALTWAQRGAAARPIEAPAPRRERRPRPAKAPIEEPPPIVVASPEPIQEPIPDSKPMPEPKPVPRAPEPVFEADDTPMTNEGIAALIAAAKAQPWSFDDDEMLREPEEPAAVAEPPAPEPVVVAPVMPDPEPEEAKGEVPVVHSPDELFAMLDDEEDDEQRYAPPSETFHAEAEARAQAIQAQLLSSHNDPVAQRLAEMLAMAPPPEPEATLEVDEGGLAGPLDEAEGEASGGIMGSLKRMFKKAG